LTRDGGARAQAWRAVCVVIAAFGAVLALPALGGVARAACVVDADCGSSNACVGVRCLGGQCAAVATGCSDGNPCTSDTCNPGYQCPGAAPCTEACVFTPVAAGTACADGDVCDGVETCDGAGACAAGEPLTCDDGSPCTRDVCDPLAGCASDAAPAAACIPALAGSLLVDERRPGAEHIVAALAQIDPGGLDIGSPLAPDAIGYTLCLYDGAGGFVADLEVEGGDRRCGKKSCWSGASDSPPGARRFVYSDPARSADGVARLLLLRRARDHEMAVKLTAQNQTTRGWSAMPTGIAGALAGGAEATMQLIGSDGTCLGGTVVRQAGNATFFRGGVQ
jgi:hypothetical protein